MDQPKPGDVLAVCPLCKKQWKVGGKEKLILTSYKMADNDDSFPKIACTSCGIEFFPKPVTEELLKRGLGLANETLGIKVNKGIYATKH